jgi:hypothetical protein
MLEVGVQHHHDVGLRDGQPCRQRRLLPEVPGEGVDEHAVVLVGDLVQDRKRVVLAAVVDEENTDLVVLEAVENFAQGLVEGVNQLLLVVAGGDDAARRSRR